MANEEHLKKLKEGVSIWNLWRQGHRKLHIDPKPLLSIDPKHLYSYGEEIDLSGVNLSGVDLSGANLDSVDLREANLSRANLSWANLYGVDLSGANLYGANLLGTTLSRATLSRADLRGANLSMANLREADLNWANLSWANLNAVNLHYTTLMRAYLSKAHMDGAELLETLFADTDLSSVRGLSSCQHAGPSMIDHRTLIKSRQLPLSFLRGCGLPEPLIASLPDLMDEPIQLYSCFISYSHQNEAFAHRLHDALQDKGVRCWYAPENMRAGKKIHEQIDEAIREYDKLLLILSEYSMQSEWVKTELANARRREVIENRRLLFPIRLVDFEAIRNWSCFDADTGKDSAREIREYFIPDFSNWKDHDSFERAFERLLRDLKADETPTNT
jgi:uncharacterized protein YjbI with pentapeptide repeats